MGGQVRPIFGEAYCTDEHDPSTPPTFGRTVADKLTNVTYVEFPRTGHGAFFERVCAQEIIAAFLMEPEKRLDLSCIDDIEFNFCIVH
jgi:hypothetical protein